MLKKDFRFREIPYNYTSFSDKEILLKYFDEKTWDMINILREQRVTGRSAKLLYEIIGDIFIIERNPYLFDDYLNNKKKLRQLRSIHKRRIEMILAAGYGNEIVQTIIEKVKTLDSNFFESFNSTRSLRQKILYSFTGVTQRKNIHFSPFHRVSHATDATDWRVEYPFAVVYPSKAVEIPKIIRLAKKLGFSIIPRGGGTGLTAGAVPIDKNSIIINTEKLISISEIEFIMENGKEIPLVSAEAGVITDDIIEFCERRGYIFATDPTSAWASTIGGNIAENAGGKKCVMWGTAIDNIYSYTIINSDGDFIKVKRKKHPHRKILPEDIIEFDIFKTDNKKEIFIKTIALNGTDIRKKGLGKDITNKALNGLPGIQKEGGDGVIISAQFVLYPPFEFCKTLCVEFYGTNMLNASRAIVYIKSEFEKNNKVFLTALEHFDEKYVSAINYRNKSSRDETPKAVLLIDIECNDQNELESGCNKIQSRLKEYNAEGITAKDDKERKLFWNDRKHLGAIAKHTNAFKLNEDIVIPLESLPEFADFIELLNFEKELGNSISVINSMNNYLNTCLSRGGNDLPKERINQFIKKLNEIGKNYQIYKETLEKIRRSSENNKGNVLQESDKEVFRKLQSGEIKIFFEEEISVFYKKVFHGYDEILSDLEYIISAERNRKVIIATHMHAGDGNIHVNIPVHSSDYLMMIEADETAGLIMKEATRLGGVVSGEHGIGLTKLKFIEKDILDKYREYKKDNDPDNLFNPGKLNSGFPLQRIYTPSFNLLEREAIILESTDLEKLSTGIASCVRCGKCKSVCNTHYPSGTMLYNPRNKILAVGLIIEAVLYSAQTQDMKSFKHFRKLVEISDHCTVCHKCFAPCPVKIDFGDISLNIRKELIRRKKSPLKLFTNAALFYLGRKKYFINKLLRILILKIGYSIQRFISVLFKPIIKNISWVAPKIINLLRIPFPKSGSKSLREIVKIKTPNTFYCFENYDMPVTKSVVYFPGCGSERMFPEISIASIALLYYSGVRVVIPPDYICCGYPFLSNGKTTQADVKSYENRVLFHRIADTAGYMNFDAVIVSCGTCLEMLQKYEIENIFNGSRLIDINEYIVQNNFYNNKSENNLLLYHEPCHTPLKHLGYEKIFMDTLGVSAKVIPNCCGEAGTLALSRPDISYIFRERKEEYLNQVNEKTELQILTTCPSCILGLSKLNASHKVTGKSITVYFAERFIGNSWQKKFIKDLKKKGIEKILF